MDSKIQPQVDTILKNGRISHSTVISGGSYPDRLWVAKYISAAQQCTCGTGVPCLTCQSCRRVMEEIHPDTEMLYPDGSMYSVAQVKDIRANSFIRPSEGCRHIFIIPHAEALSIQGQNILLKTLEEPPGSSMFILCAENPGILLPTVRSRCVIYHLESSEEGNNDDENAAAFVKILESKNSFSCARFLRGAEKMKRDDITLFLAQCRKSVAQILENKYKKSAVPTPLTAAQLVQLNVVFSTAEQYNKNNCSSGHLMGYLAAACWEALN